MSQLRTHPYHFPNLFPPRIKRQLRELIIAVTIMNFASAAVLLFEPIYLWDIGYDLRAILLYWLFVYGSYVMLMPIGAKFANRYGYEPSMLIGTIFLVLYFVSLYSIASYPFMFFVTPFVYTFQKMFYWPAFHADFARHVVKKVEGQRISQIQILTSVTSIAGPLIGSVIVTFMGFGWFFALMAFIMVFSNWFMLRTRESHTPVEFEYGHSFKRLFHSSNIRQLISYIGFGEELIMLGIWPIFIFVVVHNFFSTGVVAAVATFITVVLLYFVGRVTDQQNKHVVLRFGVFIYAIAWFLRPFISTGFHAFFADSLGRFSKSVVAVPLMAITYDNAKNHTLMNSLVFFESALALGKVVAAALGIILLTFVTGQVAGFQALFVMAGFMTLLYALLQREKK